MVGIKLVVISNHFTYIQLDSPEDKQTAGSVVRLPGIREDATPSTPIVPEQLPPIEIVYSGISLVGTAAPPTPPSTTISSLSTTQVYPKKQDLDP